MTYIGMSKSSSERGRHKRRRNGNDFYRTLPEMTQAFINAERAHIPSQVWEPACGDGAIAKMLVSAGIEVTATDLIDRGYGHAPMDFLKTTFRRRKAIITNPPFKLAYKFIAHAHRLRASYIAMLLRVSFFNGPDHAQLWYKWPVARIHNLGWRPDIFGIGSPDQRCQFSWYVWDVRHKDKYAHHYLWPKPIGRVP